MSIDTTNMKLNAAVSKPALTTIALDTLGRADLITAEGHDPAIIRADMPFSHGDVKASCPNYPGFYMFVRPSSDPDFEQDWYLGESRNISQRLVNHGLRDEYQVCFAITMLGLEISKAARLLTELQFHALMHLQEGVRVMSTASYPTKQPSVEDMEECAHLARAFVQIAPRAGLRFPNCSGADLMKIPYWADLFGLQAVLIASQPKPRPFLDPDGQLLIYQPGRSAFFDAHYIAGTQKMDGTFVVHPGSEIRIEYESPGSDLIRGDMEKREELLASDALVATSHPDGRMRLVRPWEFSSASRAAKVLMNSNAAVGKYWRPIDEFGAGLDGEAA